MSESMTGLTPLPPGETAVVGGGEDGNTPAPEGGSSMSIMPLEPPPIAPEPANHNTDAFKQPPIGPASSSFPAHEKGSNPNKAPSRPGDGTSAGAKGGKQAHEESKKAKEEGQVIKVAEPKQEEEPVDVYYVSELLDRLRQVTIRKRQLSNQRHALEMQRLQTAIALASTNEDKEALEQAAEGNEELHLESKNAFNEMENFANTLKQMMGAKGTTSQCRDLTCGEHAYCKMTPEDGAMCLCDEGYEGDGFLCRGGSTPTAHLLVPGDAKAFDIDLAVFNGAKNLACVYRDAASAGFLTLGTTSPVTVTWSPPLLISKHGGSNQVGNYTKMVEPVVAGLPSGRLGIAYRDEAEEGAAKGFLVGAEVTPSGAVTFGAPLQFALNQAKGMSILPLPQNHVAVFFSDQKLDNSGNVTAGFGSVGLFNVGDGGNVTLAGKFRFAEFPVSQIRATLLSDGEFVIAYRHVQDEPGVEKEESSVIYGSFFDGEIVLDPHPLSMEPNQDGVLARDLMLVSLNTFAYGYYLSKTQEVKVSLVEVDPLTHMMKKVNTETVSHGFTPFVKGISLAFAPKEPRSYFYFKNGAQSIASSCATPEGLSQCKNSTWAEFDAQSAAAVSIGDSRVVMAFTDELHAPHFQLLALA